MHTHTHIDDSIYICIHMYICVPREIHIYTHIERVYTHTLMESTALDTEF